MERELLADIGDRRLLPYMSLHEFEAIVFVSPTTVAEVVEGQGSPAAGDLEAIAASFRGHEEINEGRETAPSKRILGRVLTPEELSTPREGERGKLGVA